MNAAQLKKPAAAAAPVPTRMTMANVERGKKEAPWRLSLYGPEGIGKSSFAAQAEKAVFLPTEDGTNQLNVARFPLARSFKDVLDAIDTLRLDAHDYKTLVVDTLTSLEALIWDFICKRDDVGNIEGYGFGKGFEVALPEWRLMLRRLEELQATKPMHVILIGHARLATFKNPEGPDYDRWGLELHPKAAGVLKKWCDTVLFANFETFALKNERDRKTNALFSKGKAVSSGARHLYTERTAAYDAKNRFALQPQLLLDWSEFAAGVQRGADPAVLAEAIAAKAAQLDEASQEKVKDKLARAGNDTDKLILLNNTLNSMLAEKADTTTTSES